MKPYSNQFTDQFAGQYVFSEYEGDYERYVILNQADKTLKPIRVDVLDLWKRVYRRYGMPEPTSLPSVERIANYELPADKQIFKRIEIPQKLKLLEQRIDRELRFSSKMTNIAREELRRERFWNELDNNIDYYREDVEWIELQWYYRLFGYWCFINGKAYYFTGDHYWYLNFWAMPLGENGFGYPKFVDRDRRWFIGVMFAELDTTTFANLDKDGYAIPEEDGSYKMVDTGRRVCMGTLNAKGRRRGETSKAGGILGNRSSCLMEVHLEIQGVDEKGGEKVFVRNVATPFSRVPTFFAPIQNNINPKAELRFESDDLKFSMNSFVKYAKSKKGAAVDGSTLFYFYGDELFKADDNVDIYSRHLTIRKCVTQSSGNEIYGNICYTSSIEDMSTKGQEQFLKISKDSDYYRRKPNGQTLSGLYVLFFPSYDGMLTHIDKFGFSVIETPTPEQARFIKSPIGARESIILSMKSVTGEERIKQLRQDPLQFMDCFTPNSSNIFFPVEQIAEQVKHINFTKELHPRRGVFMWQSSKFGRVIFKDDKEGEWYLSRNFESHEINNFYENGGTRYPHNAGKFIISADEFQSNKLQSYKGSNGAAVGRWLRDNVIDPDDKPMEEWLTDRPFLHYCARPENMTVDDFAEEVLKACIYTGSMCYPENNLTNIENYFIKNGFGGFLLYDTEPDNPFVKKKKAGFHTNPNSKIDIFNAINDDLKKNVKRNVHVPILSQLLEIKNYDEMTKFDLIPCYGGTLLGQRSLYTQAINSQATDTNVTGCWYEFETEY